MASPPWGHRRHLLRLRVGDELPVAHRVVIDRQLEESIEEEPAAPRAATIETEDELVEITLQVRIGDRALVGAEDPALGQGSDAVYTRKHEMGRLAAALYVDRLVHVVVPHGRRVARPPIGDKGGSWLDVLGDETLE